MMHAATEILAMQYRIDANPLCPQLAAKRYMRGLANPPLMRMKLHQMINEIPHIPLACRTPNNTMIGFDHLDAAPWAVPVSSPPKRKYPLSWLTNLGNEAFIKISLHSLREAHVSANASKFSVTVNQYIATLWTVHFTFTHFAF
jgi:hypothetical protein